MLLDCMEENLQGDRNAFKTKVKIMFLSKRKKLM
jgi:hypothetical protein